MSESDTISTNLFLHNFFIDVFSSSIEGIKVEASVEVFKSQETVSSSASSVESQSPRVEPTHAESAPLSAAAVNVPTPTKSDHNLKEAVKIYLNRKSRAEHPEGSFDSGGRWYPTKSEKCCNCDSIRSPSLRYPYSLMTHCRGVEHVAELCDVDSLELKRAARKSAKQ